MIPNDSEDNQSTMNDAFIIENVSTECSSSTFASSSTTVSVNDASSDDDSNDGDEQKDATFFTNHQSSEDGSCESGESYTTDRSGGKRCCNCKCIRTQNIQLSRGPTSTNISAALQITGTYVQLVFGIFSLLVGMITVHFDLYEYLLNERMKMTPGLPPFELWEAPKPVVTMRIFIFAAENSEEFLSGADENLKLKEIGPIVYREHLLHDDVQHFENSTLSYTPKRWLEFMPDRNVDGILNQTIIVPNFVLLVSIVDSQMQIFSVID